MTRIFAVTLFIVVMSFVVAGQTQSRADLLKDLETKRAELTQLETKFLAPSAEDTATYAEFLAQPDTGLIRLMPREKFDSEVYQKKPILMVRGSGAYYSFTRHSHEYGFSTEIGLEQGHLSVGFAGADYGMLTKLEGARLEDISTELPGVLFLAKVRCERSESILRLRCEKFLYACEIKETANGCRSCACGQAR